MLDEWKGRRDVVINWRSLLPHPSWEKAGSGRRVICLGIVE